VGHGLRGQHAMGAIGLVSEALKAVYLAALGAAPDTALGPALPIRRPSGCPGPAVSS